MFHFLGGQEGRETGPGSKHRVCKQHMDKPFMRPPLQAGLNKASFEMVTRSLEALEESDMASEYSFIACLEAFWASVNAAAASAAANSASFSKAFNASALCQNSNDSNMVKQTQGSFQFPLRQHTVYLRDACLECRIMDA